MNLGKALIAGVVGGIVLTLLQFVGHGVVMGDMYAADAALFDQTINPAWFFALGVLHGCVAAYFFARTRSAWGAGMNGGIMFGAFIGLMAFVAAFYQSVVLVSYPYAMSWYAGITDIASWIGYGATVGAMYKVGTPATA